MKKSIYFYWGNETMSFMRYMTLFSFCELNPDWQVFLIENKMPSERALDDSVEERQDKTEYKGLDYSDQLRELPINYFEFDPVMLDMDPDIVSKMSDVHIKDMLNWKILAEGRGVVADMDILFTKPLTPSINPSAHIGLICFSGYPKRDYIPVSFMYASKPTEFFRKVYQTSINNYDPAVYESCGTPCIQEPNIHMVQDNYPDMIVQHFKDSIVFPYTNYPWATGIEMLYNGDFSAELAKDFVGIHWYGGAPLSQRYNNLINHKTIMEDKFANTMTIKMKEVLCLSRSSQPKELI